MGDTLRAVARVVGMILSGLIRCSKYLPPRRLGGYGAAVTVKNRSRGILASPSARSDDVRREGRGMPVHLQQRSGG